MDIDGRIFRDRHLVINDGVSEGSRRSGQASFQASFFSDTSKPN